MIAPRSARSNIVFGIAAKVVSIGVAVMSVPLLLGVLGTQGYGTWATLTSLIAFISLLDLGVGNSLRNSVSSIKEAPHETVNCEFVGFVQMLLCVGLLAAAAFAFFLPTMGLPHAEHWAALLLYVPLLVALPLLLGNSVLQGARLAGLQSVLQAASGWTFFGFVALLAWSSASPSLTDLAFTWSGLYFLGLTAIFAVALKVLRLPPGQLLTWKVALLPKGRLKVGIEFFGLQLASLVLYSLGNALIYRFLGASEVARYDVLNKLFQVMLSLYTIVIGVMWSEIAVQRAAGNAAGLRRTLRRLTGIAGLFSGACLALAAAAPLIIEFWTHDRLQVTRLEALAVAGLMSVQALAYVGAVFMNAFERIRAQIWLASVSIVLMIPLTRWLLSSGFSIAAVPIAATILTLLPMVVCLFYAVHLVRSVQPLNATPA